MNHGFRPSSLCGGAPFRRLALAAGALLLALPAVAESGTERKLSGEAGFEERAQTTVGGAKYFVTGEILKIDGEHYLLKEPSGSEVRLVVSEATNMFCGTHQGQRRTKGGQGDQPKEESGADTGFRLGDCPFQTGDYVKAETTDLGTVTYMAVATKPAGSETEEIGMPQDYGVLAVPTGELQSKQRKPRSVQTAKGEKIGTLEYEIVDKRLGKPVYGVVALQEGQLVPVPWSALEFGPEGRQKPIVLQIPVEHLSEAPAIQDVQKQIAMNDLRGYWKDKIRTDQAEKGSRESFAAPWVGEIHHAITSNEEFRKGLAQSPEQPDQLIAHLNEAARSLKEKEDQEAAREHFTQALQSLEESSMKEGRPTLAVLEEIKGTILVHAPSELSRMAQISSADMPVKMKEAVEIATREASGVIEDADFLGRYGRTVYQILIVEGTDVARMIEVDAKTGQIRTNIVLPGYPRRGEAEG